MNSDTGQLYPILHEAAYYGLAGEFTKAIAPHSEADPVAILLHALIGSGCLIGSGPHVLVEHSPHCCRLNALLVGETASRKGLAWSTPRYLFSKVDEQWVTRRVKSGLSSGEGLIYQVRDETRPPSSWITSAALSKSTKIRSFPFAFICTSVNANLP